MLFPMHVVHLYSMEQQFLLCVHLMLLFVLLLLLLLSLLVQVRVLEQFYYRSRRFNSDTRKYVKRTKPYVQLQPSEEQRQQHKRN